MDSVFGGMIGTKRKEARPVEFTLICPNDGQVELGLEDISAVVFRGSESVEVVFLCPHCGASLRAALRVPNLLVSAMELARHAEDIEQSGVQELAQRPPAGDSPSGEDEGEAELRARREREGEPYCEYFRRQLAGVECVEDLLAEME